MNRMALNNFLTPIQAQLLEVEELMCSQADDHHSDLATALRRLLDSGGKRIRPALALLTGGMLKADPHRLIILAAAIELLHTATLVHDDLIDGSFLRRGNATLNAQWSPAATVLTGDFIFAQAARLAAETKSVDVMRLFAGTLATIVNGEITQMFSGHGMIDLPHYEQRIYAKTASLFETAARSAAMLSPVEQPVIDQMRSYGYSVGMAFQIVDDVLDFTGEQATVGKPVASDLRQGLVTLPAIYYCEIFPEDREIKAILGGNHREEKDINRLISGIRESGSIHKAMDTARHFVENGLQALKDLPDSFQRRALEDLASYIVDRQL
jgi:geranylgeranyl pyrophosphate synthase